MYKLILNMAEWTDNSGYSYTTELECDSDDKQYETLEAAVAAAKANIYEEARYYTLEGSDYEIDREYYEIHDQKYFFAVVGGEDDILKNLDDCAVWARDVIKDYENGKDDLDEGDDLDMGQ